MDDFFRCALFDQEEFSLSENFEVIQSELRLEGQSASDQSKYNFKNQKIKYECQWHMQDDWDEKKPTILIPIRNNKKLIEATIQNLREKGVANEANVIVIDDRSTEDIKSSVLENNLSYLRVDNPYGFNFSMLNNIAAKICHHLNIHTIVLWNSDLWCAKGGWFPEMLKRHRDNDSTISGSKLIYPPRSLSLNDEDDSENIKQTFPQMTGGKWRETIQFGGSIFIRSEKQHLSYTPSHFLRFGDKEDPRANCNKGENFVTGAFQVIDLKWFAANGGLNPSLKKGFQDVDLCLKALKTGARVFYFGKDIYFYHDESLNFYSNKDENKMDSQAISDYILFGKIWNNSLEKLLFH
jgi:GT2 family glycosyltransferase